ncbi:MAG: cytochrome c oxidase assembly protein [Novosphingobium sp.]
MSGPAALHPAFAAARRNRRVAAIAGLFALAMLALGFAAVPLYRLFCQATGFGGTTQRVSAAQAAAVRTVAGKTISVRFDGNVAGGMPWDFRPEQVTEQVALGEREMAFFTARNKAARPITGRATFNVTPEQAGKYFNKIECFCFTEQTLRAGQEVRMPVVFYVDPAIADDPDARDVEQITLSYTFNEDRAASGDAAMPARLSLADKPLDRPGAGR